MALQARHRWSSWFARFAAAPLVVVAAAALSTSLAGAAPGDVTSTPVTFTGSGGVVLHGIVVTPAAGGARPGLVLVSGAGPQKAADELTRAEAFARGGVVSLAYDKRTTGYSQFERSYPLLAGDALAALDLLRSRAGVDPARVGMWGESEGAWVVSLAAARSPDVAFLVTVAAVGVTPARQTAWADANHLRHAGVSGSLVPAVQQTAVRLAAGAGLFPEADYDPVPAWEHVRQPVLALWGQDDQQVPVAESARIVRQALERGGNTHYTIRFVPDAAHGLGVARDGGFDDGSSLTAPGATALAPGYPELVTGWIAGLARGVPAATAEPAPRQPSAAPAQSTPLAPPRGYESPWVQAGALALFLVAFAGGPLVGRLATRRDPGPVRLAAGALAGAGLGVALGLPLYLLFVLLTAGTVVGPVVGGRPLPWLVLQALAAMATLAAACLPAAWVWRRRDVPRRHRARLALQLAGAVVFVAWAAYWGLLTP